ncbi:MAG TPA: hypothetical protein VG435_18450 [Acidimicrobiales bacterium]|jgi:hypothetical protein|nr:hypothetical protein [Acidimicrobiales bacterium]
MDMDPHPYDQLHGPAPEAAPTAAAGHRRVPRLAIGVGLTAFLGMAGAGLAFATSGGGTQAPALSASSGTSTTTSVPGGRERPQLPGGGASGGRFGGPAARGFGLMDPGGAVVHAQYTTKNGSGFRTVDMQTGQVTKVSRVSITVKSVDGYVATYAVQSSTVVDSQSGGISAVTAGDSVSVTALVKGTATTATNVVDTTKIGSSRTAFGFGSAPTQPPGAPGNSPPA